MARHCSREGNFKAKITGLSEKTDRQTAVCVATAGCVAAFLQSGTKNLHSDVVSYIFVCKLPVGQLFVSVFVEWRTE